MGDSWKNKQLGTTLLPDLWFLAISKNKKLSEEVSIIIKRSLTKTCQNLQVSKRQFKIGTVIFGKCTSSLLYFD